MARDSLLEKTNVICAAAVASDPIGLSAAPSWHNATAAVRLPHLNAEGAPADIVEDECHQW